MKKKSKPNGFLLTEALLALGISGVVSLLAVVFLQLSVTLLQVKDTSQAEFSVLQLRQELALCQSVEVEENQLHVISNHEERIYQWDKNRLVKTPGYEIFMEGVRNGKFYQKDQKIYIQIEEETFQIR